jgi:hypothetical protein
VALNALDENGVGKQRARREVVSASQPPEILAAVSGYVSGGDADRLRRFRK